MVLRVGRSFRLVARRCEIVDAVCVCESFGLHASGDRLTCEFVFSHLGLGAADLFT